MRLLAPLVALSLLAGCGADDEAADGPGALTIYVSAPLTGPARGDGQDIADGARMAFAAGDNEVDGFEVAAEYLDVAGRNEGRSDPVTAAGNARTATRDSTAIAYIGELDSATTRTSLPITNSAGILQVAPGGGAEDLVRDQPFNDDVPTSVQATGDRTFAQLVPTYEEGEGPQALALDELPPAGQDFVEAFQAKYGREPGPYAAYGYEAMASVLAALDRAGDPESRDAVIEAYFDGTERDSVLGTYEITPEGESTLGR
ncbi:MAG: ABC transporter substrate-binding protein [Actinomycetota bacterium]|nr:ABC transporter substrate-binding protein [Actinomycetota bacterium]